jgi:hypothetical protein
LLDIAFKRRYVIVAIYRWNDNPRQSGLRKKKIHREACGTTIAVCERMAITARFSGVPALMMVS